jgi:hypothetical protein
VHRLQHQHYYTLINRLAVRRRVQRERRGLADRATRGGHAYSNLQFSGWTYEHGQPPDAVGQHQSLRIQGPVRVQGWNVSPSLSIRPNRALLVNLGVGLDRNHSQSSGSRT